MPRELEAGLTEALKSEEILVDPVVKITVVEYHSRPIAVMGAVRKPVTFQADGTVTLLDALARAEGLTSDAGTEILLTRGDSVEHIPAKRLLNDADPAVNPVLQGGEEVRVPEAGKIFVLGNVRHPGAFPLRNALSEGLLPYAEEIAYVIHHDESGAPQQIPVELTKILHRKAPDVALQAGDILYVPDNKTRRNTVTILERLSNFGASTASGVLIWH
jgi:polysaccharide export outer membrane protein